MKLILIVIFMFAAALQTGCAFLGGYYASVDAYVWQDKDGNLRISSDPPEAFPDETPILSDISR